MRKIGGQAGGRRFVMYNNRLQINPVSLGVLLQWVVCQRRQPPWPQRCFATWARRGWRSCSSCCRTVPTLTAPGTLGQPSWWRPITMMWRPSSSCSPLAATSTSATETAATRRLFTTAWIISSTSAKLKGSLTSRPPICWIRLEPTWTRPRTTAPRSVDPWSSESTGWSSTCCSPTAPWRWNRSATTLGLRLESPSRKGTCIVWICCWRPGAGWTRCAWPRPGGQTPQAVWATSCLSTDCAVCGISAWLQWSGDCGSSATAGCFASLPLSTPCPSRRSSEDCWCLWRCRCTWIH